MFGIELIPYHALRAQQRMQRDLSMRESLSPESYRLWRADQDAAQAKAEEQATAERRHRQLLAAIETAGRRW